jgi:hypothetical protein
VSKLIRLSDVGIGTRWIVFLGDHREVFVGVLTPTCGCLLFI